MALIRQISEETIGQLNSLYEAGNWWKTLVDHPNTFVAVRPNNTISVYGGGGSIARISFQGNQPSLRVHVKYLAELPSAYVDLLDTNRTQSAIPVIETADQFQSRINQVIERASRLQAGERRGEVTIANRCLSVIDIELAYAQDEEGAEDPVAEDGGSGTGRIDLVSLGRDGVLRFVEAKLFRNKELRARGTPVVCGQLSAYHQWLTEMRSEIAGEYQSMVGQLAKLEGNAFQRFKIAPKTITRIDTIPRLLVFGFDQQQQSFAKELAENITRSTKIGGFTHEMITCVGNASNVTDEHLTR